METTLPNLTDKQTHFVKNVTAGLSPTEAGKRAGYSPESIHSIVSRLMSKPDIKSTIETLADLSLPELLLRLRAAESLALELGDVTAVLDIIKIRARLREDILL